MRSLPMTKERYAWDHSQSGMLHSELLQFADMLAISTELRSGGSASLPAPPRLVHLLPLLLLLDERPKFVSDLSIDSCLEGHNLEGSTSTKSLNSFKWCSNLLLTMLAHLLGADFHVCKHLDTNCSTFFGSSSSRIHWYSRNSCSSCACRSISVLSPKKNISILQRIIQAGCRREVCSD